MNNTHYLHSFFADQTSIALGYYQEGTENVAYDDGDMIELGSGALISHMKDLQTFFKCLVHEIPNQQNHLLTSCA